jgi:hypothetical protein
MGDCQPPPQFDVEVTRDGKEVELQSGKQSRQWRTLLCPAKASLRRVSFRLKNWARKEAQKILPVKSYVKGFGTISEH